MAPLTEVKSKARTANNVMKNEINSELTFSMDVMETGRLSKASLLLLLNSRWKQNASIISMTQKRATMFPVFSISPRERNCNHAENMSRDATIANGSTISKDMI